MSRISTSSRDELGIFGTQHTHVQANDNTLHSLAWDQQNGCVGRNYMRLFYTGLVNCRPP